MFPEPGCKSQDVIGRWDRLEQGERMQGQSSEVDLFTTCLSHGRLQQTLLSSSGSKSQVFGHQVFKKFQSDGPEQGHQCSQSKNMRLFWLQFNICHSLSYNFGHLCLLQPRSSETRLTAPTSCLWACTGKEGTDDQTYSGCLGLKVV